MDQSSLIEPSTAPLCGVLLRSIIQPRAGLLRDAATPRGIALTQPLRLAQRLVLVRFSLNGWSNGWLWLDFGSEAGFGFDFGSTVGSGFGSAVNAMSWSMTEATAVGFAFGFGFAFDSAARLRVCELELATSKIRNTPSVIRNTAIGRPKRAPCLGTLEPRAVAQKTLSLFDAAHISKVNRSRWMLPDTSRDEV